jgi:hypothetical protein
VPDRKNEQRRQYPPIYEKIVPIALALIGLAIFVILIVILAVALGMLPGS